MNTFNEKVFTGFENELKLYYCGKRYRSISHRYGPYEQNKYLIYYIKEGVAELKVGNKTTEISATGFFVNFPNSNAVYRCKANSPWTIKWIMAEGAIIEKYLDLLGITPENPYIKLDNSYNIEGVFDEMYDFFDKNTVSAKIYCISLAHKLFSVLSQNINEENNEKSYIVCANREIEQRFSNPDFNVSMLAEILGLNRNYFSILYKKQTGTSPIKAINDYRLKNACKMLKFTDKPIKIIALNCGYTDELYFSRVFSKKLGMSPSVYRQKETIDM